MKKRLGTILIQGAIFLMVLEVLLAVFVNLGLINIEKPDYSLKRKDYWALKDPGFGVWREPNSSYRHIKGCFDVTYTANQAGARDVERSFKSSRKRVVVLGDSFTEGWGVQQESRFSNLLETKTGIEFLNFGISGVGMTQEYLIYKNKAMSYDHDAVLWMLFPINDIADDDFANSKTFHEGLFRPYWVGEYPDYQISYGTKSFEDALELSESNSIGVKGLLSRFTYTYHLVSYLKRRYIQNEMLQANPDLGEVYFNIPKDKWNRMRYSIERLISEAKGKKLYIVTIPDRHSSSKYLNDNSVRALSDSLSRLSKELGFQYYDLLEEADKMDSKEWFGLLFDCDDHWNEKGHTWAAETMDTVFSFSKSFK